MSRRLISQRAQFFHPFDVTYGEVNRRVRFHLASLGPTHEADWLKNIIWSFQSEADQWDCKEELRPYRDSMSRLHLNILRLAAGAYLHIAYDLPRVLADHWPGSPPNDPPDQARGFAIYGYIGRLFSEVLDDVRVMPEVVGITGPALKWNIATRAMNMWVKTLRDAAWLHAQQLTGLSPARRTERERDMLTAITEALNETSAWMPWDALKLTSPNFLYDESPGHRPLYFLGMPLIPFDVMAELQLVTEVIELIMSAFILFFVFRNWRPRQETFRLQNSKSTLGGADEAAAEYIDRLGSGISHRLNQLFNQV